MYLDGGRAKHCGCATACRRTSSLVVMLQLILVTKTGTEYPVHNFTSKSFTNVFLRNGVPNGVVESMINGNTRKKNVWRARMTNAIKHINECHGFNVSGWVRRGMVEDQSAIGAAAAPGSASSKTFIASSELKIHVTKITINMGGSGDTKPDITNFLFDLASISVNDGGML